jgi:hypothetical protein
VRIKSGSAPLFWTPNNPPVQEGVVAFDMKGAIVRTKYPEGHGPKTNLFDPVMLQKALDTIGQRLDPHLKLTELMVSDDDIAITAQDPRNPKKLAIFVYKDEDVSRTDNAREMVANSFGFGPDWLFDLAAIHPLVVQSFSKLEQETMTRLGMPNGKVERITISKDKMFHPRNDRVLIEIRASGDGKDTDWVTFDLTGAVADPDKR